jgi:hypothetical protein
LHVLPMITAVLATIEAILDAIAHMSHGVSSSVLSLGHGGRDEQQCGRHGEQLDVHSHVYAPAISALVRTVA